MNQKQKLIYVWRILVCAQMLISDKENWCQESLALAPIFTNKLEEVEPIDPRATRWCALGSIDAFADSSWDNGVGRHTARTYLYRAYNALGIVDVGGRDNIAYVNDVLGWKTVMEVFDEAIRLVEGDIDYAKRLNAI